MAMEASLTSRITQAPSAWRPCLAALDSSPGNAPSVNLTTMFFSPSQIINPLAARRLFGYGTGQVAGELLAIYVDSVAGNDSNDGLSASAPKLTLASAKTAATSAGLARFKLKRGSTWRESFNISSYTAPIVDSYGDSGNPPVITGLDIKTGWTNDLTNTNLWYVDITHDGAGTNRSVVLQDGALMVRKLSAASANGITGAYYSADNATRIYINPGGNPNSNGKVYEVCVRYNAVFAPANSTITGIVAKAAMSNNGPIEAGAGSVVRRCVAAFGTKHNVLLASGTMEDTVLIEADAASASEAGRILFVGFKEDASGLDLALTRVMFYASLGSDVVYAHTLNDPSDSHRNISIDQCIAQTLVGSAAFGGGCTGAYALTNSAAYGVMNSSVYPFADTVSVSRCLLSQNSDADNTSGNTGAAVTWSQSCIDRSGVAGGSRPPLANRAGALSVNHCSVSVPASYYGAAVGWVPSTSAGSLSINRSVVLAANTVIVPVGGDLASSDQNVYTLAGGAMYNTIAGNYYNLVTNMAGWRSASGDDANAIALQVTP